MNGRVQGLLLALAVVTVLGLAVFYLFLAEPGRDELCRAALGTAPGTAMDYVTRAYRHETGRWLALGLYAAVLPRFDPYGIGYGFALLALFLFWFGGFLLAVDLILGGNARRRDRFSLAVLLFAIFWCGAPSHEGINWLTGATEYGVPFFLIMLTLRLAAEIGQPGRGLWCAIAAGGASILASAMHELAGALLLVGLLCIMAVLWRLKHKRALRNGLVLLALCLIGFLVSGAAPGNAARASHYADGGRWLLALALTARPYAGPLAWFADVRLVVLTVLLLTLPDFRTLRPAWTRVDLPLALIVPVALLLIICGDYFLGSLIQGMGPGGRNLDFYYALFVLGWLASLVAITAAFDLPGGNGSRQQSVRAGAVLLLAIGLVASPGASAALQDLPKALTVWRQENRGLLDGLAEARAAGQSEVIVQPMAFVPRLLFDPWIKEDPRFWSNRCMARYHRLRSIRQAPGSPPAIQSGQSIVFGTGS